MKKMNQTGKGQANNKPAGGRGLGPGKGKGNRKGDGTGKCNK